MKNKKCSTDASSSKWWTYRNHNYFEIQRFESEAKQNAKNVIITNKCRFLIWIWKKNKENIILISLVYWNTVYCIQITKATTKGKNCIARTIQLYNLDCIMNNRLNCLVLWAIDDWCIVFVFIDLFISINWTFQWHSHQFPALFSMFFSFFHR